MAASAPTERNPIGIMFACIKGDSSGDRRAEFAAHLIRKGLLGKYRIKHMPLDHFMDYHRMYEELASYDHIIVTHPAMAEDLKRELRSFTPGPQIHLFHEIRKDALAHGKEWPEWLQMITGGN